MKDMTQGKPLKLIIGFAVPMLIGNIFQQVYNVADTVIVGRFLGESTLAGVGSTGTLTYFLLRSSVACVTVPDWWWRSVLAVAIKRDWRRL